MEQFGISFKKLQRVHLKLFHNFLVLFSFSFSFFFFFSVYSRPNFFFYRKMLLLESILMNRASFGNMTKSCEVSVSIWEDLVLTPKRFKECAQNHFWHVFSFLLSSLHANLFLLLRSFQLDEYELCLLWKADKFLRDKCLYFGQYGIGCQVFRRVHPKSLLPSFFIQFTK